VPVTAPGDQTCRLRPADGLPSQFTAFDQVSVCRMCGAISARLRRYVVRRSPRCKLAALTHPPLEGDGAALKGGPRLSPIAPEKRGSTLDPILDPNARIHIRTSRATKGRSHLLRDWYRLWFDTRRYRTGRPVSNFKTGASGIGRSVFFEAVAFDRSTTSPTSRVRSRLAFKPCPSPRLGHNQVFGLDVETPARHRHGIRVIHRRRARLEDERPQLREVVTPIVKI